MDRSFIQLECTSKSAKENIITDNYIKSRKLKYLGHIKKNNQKHGLLQLILHEKISV